MVPSAAAVDSEIGSVFLVKIFSVISFFLCGYCQENGNRGRK